MNESKTDASSPQRVNQITDVFDISGLEEVTQAFDRVKNNMEKALKRVNQSDKQIGGIHYSKVKIDPITYAEENGLSSIQFSVVKYISRYKHKGTPVEDLKKAIHFCTMALNREHNIETNIEYVDNNEHSASLEDISVTSPVCEAALKAMKEGKDPAIGSVMSVIGELNKAHDLYKAETQALNVEASTKPTTHREPLDNSYDRYCAKCNHNRVFCKALITLCKQCADSMTAEQIAEYARSEEQEAEPQFYRPFTYRRYRRTDGTFYYGILDAHRVQHGVIEDSYPNAKIDVMNMLDGLNNDTSIPITQNAEMP